MKPTLSYHIDLTGNCNLRCPSCSMGRKEEYPSHLMKEEELVAIIEKACKEAYPLGIWLYNYTEPFMHPRLPEMVRIVKSFKLPVYISTNLNITKNIPEVMEADPTTLMASMSGFTQEIYSQTHTAGNIEQVKENMKLVSRTRINTLLKVHWHRYQSNLHEEPLMREFVKSLPAKWDFYAYKAVRIDLEEVLKRFEGGDKNPLEDNLLRSLEEAKELCKKRTHYGCQLQEGTVSLNSKGEYRLCCSVYKSNLPIHYSSMCINDFLKLRYKSDYCKRCQFSGGHVYAMELYDEPIHSIRLKLEEIYRKIPARGLLANQIAKIRSLNIAAKAQ